MRLRNGGGDLQAMRDSFFNNEYRLGKPRPGEEGRLVVDVGAHVGCFALLAAVAGWRNLLCVEPEEENAALLTENLAGLEADFPGLRCVAMGAAVVPPGFGPVALARPVEAAVSTCWRAVPDGSGRVRRVTPAVLFDGRPVAVCKVDIEGGEADLFDGTPDDVLRLPDEWLVEVHPEVHGRPVSEFAARFEALGYEASVSRAFEPWGTNHLTAARKQ